MQDESAAAAAAGTLPGTKAASALLLPSPLPAMPAPAATTSVAESGGEGPALPNEVVGQVLSLFAFLQQYKKPLGLEGRVSASTDTAACLARRDVVHRKLDRWRICLCTQPLAATHTERGAPPLAAQAQLLGAKCHRICSALPPISMRPPWEAGPQPGRGRGQTGVVEHVGACMLGGAQVPSLGDLLLIVGSGPEAFEASPTLRKACDDLHVALLYCCAGEACNALIQYMSETTSLGVSWHACVAFACLGPACT